MKTIYFIVLIFSLVIAATPVFANKSTGHFVFAGSASQFMQDGKTPAKVSSGLAFSIVITDGGSTVSLTGSDWKIPGAKGNIRLLLAGAAYASGTLSGTIIVKNDSGFPLDGLRMDITGAAATIAEKQSSGNEITKTVSESAALDSPLLLGEVDTGHTTDGETFSITGLSYEPSARQLVLNGVLSGTAFLHRWTANQGVTMKQMDFDQTGRIYLTNTTGNRVVRYDADGSHETTIAKLPGQNTGLSVQPSLGEIYATCSSNRSTIFKFSPRGVEDGKIEDKVGLDCYPTLLRFDRKGNLFAASDTGLYVFSGDKIVQRLEQAGDVILATTGFDIAPDGSIWLVMENGLNHLSADGKTCQLAASGQDWHLGRLLSALSCRTDAQGNIYVVELGRDDDENYEPPRVSEFDKDGNFMRVFGFGSATKRLKNQNLPGQILYPLDIGVAPNGHVFVAGRDGDGNRDLIISEFMPF